MQKVRWELEYLSTPRVIRRCQKCGEKTNYESSGLFRVNAQKKSLDIWMIYKCKKCDTTWNAEIYTRINQGKLSEEVLDQFHRNDPVLAQYYAMNTEWLKRLRAEIIFPDYKVKGSDPADLETTEIHIINQYAIPYKVSAVLRKKLCLSQTAFIKMTEQAKIRSENGEDLKKIKMPKELIIIINTSNI